MFWWSCAACPLRVLYDMYGVVYNMYGVVYDMSHFAHTPCLICTPCMTCPICTPTRTPTRQSAWHTLTSGHTDIRRPFPLCPPIHHHSPSPSIPSPSVSGVCVCVCVCARCVCLCVCVGACVCTHVHACGCVRRKSRVSRDAEQEGQPGPRME